MADVSVDSVSNLSPELQKAFQMAVKAEMRPLNAINERKEQIEDRVKLLDDIIGRVESVRTLLPGMNTPFSMRELAFSSQDDHLITGTADKNEASVGKHSLEILQLARSAGALSNRFEDADNTRIGSGYFSYTRDDGESIDIFIDNENSTLRGIASTINSSNSGLKATVIRDEQDPELPFRLLLSSSETGKKGDIKYPEFYFIDGEEDFFIDEEKGPVNSRVRYEGFDVESPSNEIKDLIRGVTLNLRGVSGEGRPVSVSIENDIPKTTVKVKDLVDGLNGVFGFIQEQNSLNENSNTRRTLGGDYGIRHTDDRIKSALRENFLFREGKTVQSLTDVGIQFDKKGMLQFDEKKFQHAIQTNYEEVTDLLAGDGRNYGVIPKLSQALASVSNGPGGILSNQKRNYASQINQIDRDLQAKQQRSEEKIESLKEKLARAQTAMAQMENQGNFIGAQAKTPSPAAG